MGEKTTHTVKYKFSLLRPRLVVCVHLCYRCRRLQQDESPEDDPATRARRVYHMGNLLQKRGQVKEAAKMYRSAVKLDPTHKASHYNLGKRTSRSFCLQIKKNS